MSRSNGPYYQLSNGTQRNGSQEGTADQYQHKGGDGIEGMLKPQGDDGNPSNDSRDPSAHQFAGLLQAVTVAGQEAARNDLLQQQAIASMHATVAAHSPAEQTPAAKRGKRKRTSSDTLPTPESYPTAGKRRAKQEQEHLDAHTAHPQGPPDPSYPDSPHPQLSLSPTSALFPPRRTALSSGQGPAQPKKQTRPPVSQLYTSLHLAPTSFLHLQSAAKAYTLDPAHPERRDCVGSRSKGGSDDNSNNGGGGLSAQSTSGDAVRLRLWEVARAFLEEDGLGRTLFSGAHDGDGDGDEDVGAGASTAGQERYVWPRDAEKIIRLVMPLLRRMVTNERQRQYAVQTRGAGGGVGAGAQGQARNGRGSVSGSVERDVGVWRQQQQQQQQGDGAVAQQEQEREQEQEQHIDPLIATLPTPRHSDGLPSSSGAAGAAAAGAQSRDEDPRADVLLQVHVLRHATQAYLCPRLDLPAAVFAGVREFRRYLAEQVPGVGEMVVRVHGVDGLVDIGEGNGEEGERAWRDAVEECGRCVWMERVVRVVVEVVGGQ